MVKNLKPTYSALGNWRNEYMKHQVLLTEFREELALLKNEVALAASMGHFDINHICENLFCGLLKILFELDDLRNLNTEERKNYPAIDLADDQARVAIQVTSTNSLEKIKDTLLSVVKHDLDTSFDRIVVYIISDKQKSYSQSAINRILEERLKFDVHTDIWDHQDIASQASKVSPHKLAASLDLLRSYTRGVAVGLSDQDFDPPDDRHELTATNLVEVYAPNILYIADLLPEVIQKRGRTLRKHVRQALAEHDQTAPSSFEVRSDQIITFHPLEDNRNPFARVIDTGTVTPLESSEFYLFDEDQERTFKSLMRFQLQHQLYQHRVIWKHEDGLFAFYPQSDGDQARTESWVGKRTATRKVFARKMNKNDPSKVLSVKHLAFSPQFVRLINQWYISITPNWYFSYGDDYRRSGFSEKQLTGMKRLERNRSIYDQFRFWATWLSHCDDEDLFAMTPQNAPMLTFGEILTVEGALYLDEERWAPLEELDTDDLHPEVQRSFHSL